MRRALIIAIVVVSVASSAQSRERPARTAPTQWTAPQCSTVLGLPGFYFTFDESATYSANAAPDPTNMPVLVALTDLPNRLIAVLGDGVYESDDAGCTWRLRGRVPDTFSGIIAARGSRAYAWSNRQAVLLLVTASTNHSVAVPEPLLALGVDGAHLVAAGQTAVHESFDDGATWSVVGPMPPDTAAAAIDPHDVLHIVAGYRGGGQVSRDGGRTWELSDAGGADQLSLAFSPSNSNVIWMMSLLSDVHANGLQRSADGGQSFPLVLQTSQTSDGLHFTHGSLFPHPTDDAIVAVQTWQGLTIIDARTATGRTGRNHYWDWATWSPAPGVMYLTTEIFEGTAASEQMSK